MADINNTLTCSVNNSKIENPTLPAFRISIMFNSILLLVLYTAFIFVRPHYLKVCIYIYINIYTYV